MFPLAMILGVITGYLRGGRVALANRQLPGMGLVALGTGLNLLVIAGDALVSFGVFLFIQRGMRPPTR